MRKKLFKFVWIFFMIALFVMTSISCSSRTIVEVNDKGTGGKITTNISFAPFFTAYLKDLIGFRAFSDLINLNELNQYFEGKKSVKNVYTSVSNDPESIVVHLDVGNLLDFFEDMGIKYETQDLENHTYVKLQVAKSFIKEIITQLPTFKDMNEEQLFLFEQDSIPRDKFAEYIGWALSDYEDSKIIKTTVARSFVSIVMQKEKENYIIPDKTWTKMKKNIQQKKLSFSDVIYEENFNLSYTY